MWNKFVPFNPVEEDWYHYRIQDGTILKVRYHLRHLMRRHSSGFLYSLGQYDRQVEEIGPDLTDAKPQKYQYPKLIKKGTSAYKTFEGQTIGVRPSFYEVVRDLDSKGSPTYEANVWWIIDQPMNEIMHTLTRRSTIVTAGGNKDKAVDAIKKERDILEWLFTKEWFQNRTNRNHSAFLQWTICNQAIQWGGSKPDRMTIEQMLPIAKVGLNASLLIKLTDGDLQMLLPGKFESFGNEEIRKKFKKIDADQFDDLFVELYTAGWHKTEGRTATFLQGSHLPDVRVDSDSLPFPILIECKRIRGSSDNVDSTIRDDIKDASSKIENASKSNPHAYGSVLLDFSAMLGEYRATNNSIPDKILGVMEVVRQALSGNKNTHVKSAIVVWDDFNENGEIPQPVILTAGRRAIVLNHEYNSSPLSRSQLFDGTASRLLWQQTPDEFLPENQGL